MIYYEKNLLEYKGMTNLQLRKLYKSGDEEARIVLAKRNLGIAGDVYLHNGIVMNLKRHNMQFKCNCSSIEEAFLNFKKHIEDKK